MTVADSKTRLINLLIELWLDANYQGVLPSLTKKKTNKQSPPHALRSGSNNITFLNKIHPLLNTNDLKKKRSKLFRL